MRIKGVDDDHSGDVGLPVSVYHYGMAGWLWEYVSLAAAVLSFILGCAFLTKSISRLWNRAWGRETGHDLTT
jgi:hypothetical protein